MSNIDVTIKVDTDKLGKEYIQDINEKAYRVIQKYSTKVQNEAREILTENQYIDTGRLRGGISASVKRLTNKITGEINTGKTPYAEYLHEGTKHEGNELIRYFVPFSVSPSLYRWAKRKGIEVEQDGGLMVSHPALKYLEKPFEDNEKAFIKEMEDIVK